MKNIKSFTATEIVHCINSVATLHSCKANALIRLQITASKSLINAFAVIGGAGAICLAVVVIVSCAAVVFEMAGYDEEVLASGLDVSQFTEAAFGEGSDGIVKTAKAELGNKGGKKYWKWYGFDERVEWCAVFCSWCGAKCGLIDQALMPKFADCKVGMNWFRKKNRWLKLLFSRLIMTPLFSLIEPNSTHFS